MQSAHTPREVLIPHVSPIETATHVRSTLVQSSMNTLKSLGHFDRYVELLDPAQKDMILQTLAPVWLPMGVASAHYAACDALNLTDSDLILIGEAVGDRIQGAFLTTLSRSARVAGVTPWLILKQFDKLWRRLLQGGSVELSKVGPKDVLIEVRGAVLPEFEYFRVAFCGVVRAGYKFAGVRVAQVKVERWVRKDDLFVMRAAWV